MQQLLKIVWKIVPDFFKPLLKKIIWLIVDITESILGRSELTPPRSMICIGECGHKAYGEKFKHFFINIGQLKPTDSILDVGCGAGGLAVPLAKYLTKDGEYHGFDIIQKRIKWCQIHISKKYPNFHFQHSDVMNMNYNPKGIYQSSTYSFPYKNESFDFVFLLSVFTHMFTPDMENYLKEITRVLKKNGKCFITYFLLNDESEQLIKKGISTQNLIYNINGCITSNKDNPEEANGFEEKHIKLLYKKNGLEFTEPIFYGSWCGRSKFLDYQDIIIATKK